MIPDFIKKIPSRITLFVMQSEKFRSTVAIALLAIAVCYGLQWLMLGKVPEKLAFFIDGFSYTTNKLTVGKGSDISFSNVPADYLSIERNDSGFVWKVNEAYKDTLQYFKVDNDNPNAHKLINDDTQRISIEVPAMHGTDLLSLELTGEDIYDEWDSKFAEQKVVLLRNFAVHYAVRHKGYNASDSLGYMQQKQVSSILSRDDDGIKLVVLDEKTSIDGQSYRRSGFVEGDRVKVQFFSVSDYCYLDDDSDDSFRVNGVNYVAKPSVKLTAWGAGHAMIKAEDKALKVTFPRPVGYVESLDSLRAMAAKTSGLITLKQSDVSFPTKNDIYLPQMSRVISNDICNLSFNGDEVYVKNNSTDSTKVVSGKHLVPTLEKMSLANGAGVMQCRVGIIDGHFVWSYLWLPLATAILLIILTVGPTSAIFVRKKMLNRIGNYNRLKNYAWYMLLLILIALAFCVSKSMIALKLSYSYPYFEKMTGIMPVATSLMLLFFFTLALILNVSYVKMLSPYNKGLRSPYVTLLVLAGAFAALIYAFFNILDPAVNSEMVGSYYDSETRILSNPLKWVERVGINDTHRSVVYTLILLEGIALAVLTVALSAWKRISKKITDISNWAQISQENACDFVSDKVWPGIENWLLTFIKKLTKGKYMITITQKACDDPNEKLTVGRWISATLGRLPFGIVMLAMLLVVDIIFGANKVIVMLEIAATILIVSSKTTYLGFVYALRTLFPWHILLLAMLVLAGMALGNFGTAFITAAVIIGLCKALGSVEFDNPNTPNIQEGLQPLEVLWQMLFISIFYIVAAMAADNGYMTNYLGFFVAFLCFFFLIKKPGWEDMLAYRINRSTARWVYVYLSVLLVLIVSLPVICSKMFDPDDVHYERFARRMMLYSNFDELQDAGYRYTETDAEFMVVMSHYMQHRDGGDPLSNDKHLLHASVSSGQSPVVLNDLSMPVAFFGSYGTTLTTMLFFLLLGTLLFVVMRFSLSMCERPSGDVELCEHFMWRILAVSLWIGTSLYLYFSYIDLLPFTGRLIPGFGVDAVGEALETSILLAFMASVAGNSVNIIEEKKDEKDKILIRL